MIRKVYSLMFLIFVLIILSLILYPEIIKLNDKLLVKSYLNNPISYGYREHKVLVIPSINVESIIRKTDLSFDNLKNSLVYLGEFDVQNKIIILGHSGMGSGTFFNRIDHLKINDEALIWDGNKKYKYFVNKLYSIDYRAVDILDKEEGSSKLILITCDKKDKTKRLIAELLLKSR